MKPKPDKKHLQILSPWIIIGAVVVLLPIVLIMALNTIQLQRSSAFQLLTEKGQALIRSFEAGTQTVMIEQYWGWAHLQRLLTATASQPDIAYIMLTDTKGQVLAHSDPKQIGSMYNLEIDLNSLVKDNTTLTHIRPTADGEQIFEVIKHFTPFEVGNRMGMGMGMRRGHMMMHRWYWPEDAPRKPSSDQALVIFIGLKTGAIIEAQQRDVRHIIIMAAILFLVGIAGVALIFLTHNYKLAKSSLSKVKAFSDQVVKQMPLGLIAWNEDGRVVAVNRVARELLELEQADPVGSPVTNVLPDKLLAIVNQNPRFLGRLDQDLEWSGKDKEVALQVTGAPLFESGVHRGYVCLLKDLSEVTALRRQVERHKRLATMGRLAAGVAHEIRNPLSSIKGFATYFKERCNQEDQNSRIADLMIQEVDRLNRVVTQLLEFSRPVQVSPRSVELEGQLSDSIQLITERAKRQGVTLKLECPQQEQVVLDPDLLKQVLLNLYLNALDAMPSGGQLTVNASLDKDRSKLMLEITDTGEGMEANMVSKVFDPYFTTKSGGTGLGLAIVHNIVEAHNGRISLESWPGGGSRVKICLPLQKEPR